MGEGGESDCRDEDEGWRGKGEEEPIGIDWIVLGQVKKEDCAKGKRR